MKPSNTVLLISLANYLKTELDIPVHAGWPDPKVELELPSISIIPAGNYNYTHQMPVQHKLITNPDSTTTEVTEVGFHDGRIQLDIWAEYPAQRDDIFQKLNKALNKAFYDSEGPMGLSLELEDYHNAIARVDQVGYSNLDSGDNAQRAEWRTKVDCLVNFPELVEKTVSTIKELTVEMETISETQTVDETFEIF